jgi:hypothetical protein
MKESGLWTSLFIPRRPLSALFSQDLPYFSLGIFRKSRKRVAIDEFSLLTRLGIGYSMLFYAKIFSLFLLSGWLSGAAAQSVVIPLPNDTRIGAGRSFQTSILPLILPLEATIGKLYIGRNLLFSAPLFHGESTGDVMSPPSFVSSEIQMAEEPVIIKNSASPFGKSDYYRRKDDIGILLQGEHALFDFNLTRFAGMRKEEFQNGDALSGKLTFGYGFGRKEESLYSLVHILLGFTSSFYYPDRNAGKKVTGTEYGEVFFSPGLQITKSSIMFHAMVELPVYHSNLELLPSSREDQIRANFGMKYYLH